jgi:hypothetical protein
MKKTAYFFLVVIATAIAVTPKVYASKGKDQKASEASKVAKTESTTVKESAWLNKKNFPNLQESTCPFYLVKPGC